MAQALETERLLILIPAYNEAGAIRHVIRGVKTVVPQADILVIDDGSADDTGREAQQAGALVLRQPVNLGIGGTVQTGLKFALQQNYDCIVRIDGDGQHNPLHILSIISALKSNDADIVIGSRFLTQEASMAIPFIRRLGIFVFAKTVSLLTGKSATDTTSGLFGMHRRSAEVLANCMPQDYPEVESRIILHRAGIKVLEIPTPMFNRFAGVSSINAWRSIYYACKVLIAVLLTTVKELPAIS